MTSEGITQPVDTVTVSDGATAGTVSAGLVGNPVTAPLQYQQVLVGQGGNVALSSSVMMVTATQAPATSVAGSSSSCNGQGAGGRPGVEAQLQSAPVSAGAPVTLQGVGSALYPVQLANGQTMLVPASQVMSGMGPDGQFSVQLGNGQPAGTVAQVPSSNTGLGMSSGVNVGSYLMEVVLRYGRDAIPSGP